MSTALQSLHPSSTVYATVESTIVPWRFTDTAEEYDALRNRTALLDLSGLRLIELRGDATGTLQRVLARDVEFLNAERCLSGLVLDDDGRLIDIVVVYGRDNGALLEASFGGGDALLAHLRRHADDGVEVIDRTDLAIVGVEGPYSWGVVGRLVDRDLPALPFESSADTTFNDEDIIFARAGFTGEYGYKVIASAPTAREFWRQAAEWATPVGQEVLEIGMIEVRQPLRHREAVDGSGVITLGLNWLMDSTKASFIGRDAVMAEFAGRVARRTIGFAGTNPGQADLVPGPGARILADGEEVGVVVHATHSLGLGQTLGLARIDTELAAARLPVTIETADGVRVPARTLSSPYILPKSWGIPIV
jgi:aminomethyltransferase